MADSVDTPIAREIPARVVSMRRRIAITAQVLVDLLDVLDVDAEREEDDPPEDDAPCEDVGDNEPSLGATGTFFFPDQRHWAQGTDDDREVEDEHDEPTGDEEPALGSTTAVNQEHAWRANADAWGSCDEAEPSLGWTGHGRGHPEMALRGYDDDREHDDEREEDHDFEEDYGR